MTATGEVNIDEPFAGLFTQGMVIHETYRDPEGRWLLPDVGFAVLLQRGRGDALGVRSHRPSATIRSIAPRARAAMSGGTVM